MPMSFDGDAASSSGCGIKPKVLGIGSTAFVGRTGISSRTGSYAMATAEHREPCDSRRSCTVLGAPGGESPPGDSTRTVLETRSRQIENTSLGIWLAGNVSRVDLERARQAHAEAAESQQIMAGCQDWQP